MSGLPKVVIATVHGEPNPVVAVGWGGADWDTANATALDSEAVTDRRPLLLVDPEDSRGVAIEIAQTVGEVVASPGQDISRIITAVQAALRSLAQPATPEPRDPAVRVLTGGNIVGHPAIAGAEREWARGTNGRWACLTDNAPGFQEWSDLVASYGPVRFTGVVEAKP